MGHIFRNLPEIPIPPGAYINHHDARVFLINIIDGKQVRRVIGTATSDTMMHPNTNFQLVFPELWNEHYPQQPKVPSCVLHTGLYAVTLKFAEDSGLYKIINDVFGPEYGNAIMDYNMYCMDEHSNSTIRFEDYIKNKLCFSRKTFSDAWYSDLFSNKITEDQIHLFRTKWVNKCAMHGNDKVWLCIDGSNTECTSQSSNLPEQGYNKKHTDKPIISYIWAVSSKNGIPVTWFVNNGSMVDQKAFNEIVQFLAASNIHIEGVILDRGFCSHDVLKLINKLGFNYVVMLKSNTNGYKEMMLRHADEIRHKSRYIVNKRGVFGTTDRVRLFAESEEDTCVGLYFDWSNSSGRGVTLLSRILECKEQLESTIDNNTIAIDIPSNMKKYIGFDIDANNKYIFYLNNDEIDKAFDCKGYSAIACSIDTDAISIDNYYNLRDISEKMYCQLKTQLGYDTIRVSSTRSIESKLACAFISSIIRTQIAIVCNSLNMSTNCMLLALERCSMMLMSNGQYGFIDNLSGKSMKFFESFGLHKGHFAYLEADANNRRAHAVISQVRSLSSVPTPVKRRPGRPPKPKTEEVNREPGKPGRPTGRKNNKTLEREAAQQATQIAQPEKVAKRGPGRPKGSKNKKTIEREAALQAIQAAEPNKAAEPKRGPGRPKGSKNKTKQEREALALARKTQTKRPGRPKGSRNKKTLEREAEEARQHQPKQGPGRLKGGKNKKTIEREVKKQQQERRKMRLAKKRSESEAQDGAIVKNE